MGWHQKAEAQLCPWKEAVCNLYRLQYVLLRQSK